MPKTITMRIDDSVYSILKQAASGHKRTISNFLEYAAINYISADAFVSDEEMDEILKDKQLMHRINLGLSDIKKGKYKVVL